MTVLRKITYKKVAIFLLVLFFISLLPVFYCSFFDYATGDDLWEGAAAYRVLANHGSVKEFFREVFLWAKNDYLNWEGNWSSIVLWCLEPSIWGEKVYCITPWIALGFLCGGTAYFLNHFLKKYLYGSRFFWVIVSVITCFFSVHYMPYPRGGIYWYTGMVNYVVPYGICLMSFVWIDKFIETGRKRYCIWTALAFTFVSGAGYTPVVLAFEVLSMFILAGLFRRNKLKTSGLRWLCLPLFLLIAGFIFSAISPGNAARGGDSYYLGLTKVLLTILESVKQGFWGGINWFITVRPLFLAAPLLFIVTWEQVDIAKIQLKLKYPVRILLLLFLISCSVYAPGIYAESEVSGGVPDSIYFVFILVYVLGVIYLTCCLKKLCCEKGWSLADGSWTEKFRVAVLLGVTLFCIVFGKHLVGNMAGYICLDFIRSGQLKDFEFQMQERLAILHDPEITNVVLPEMNDEQGPFLHMALLSDPNAYTNQATARFYGKESVIAIPRSEYYELYGYPENDKLKRE